MRETRRRQPAGALVRYAMGVAAVALGLGAQAASLTINAVDGSGAPVNGFKYLIQEDRTYAVDPAGLNFPPAREDMLSFNFHASNHPPAIAGSAALSGFSLTNTVTLPDVLGARYFVSVLPHSGHSMGGAPVSVDGTTGTATVNVVVEKHPIPTAQIAIFLFEDNYPLNGTPDLPEEENPPAGQLGADGRPPVDWTQFSILLEDPAGRYGQNGGPVLQDAFGNQLGTSYVQTCDATGANPGSGTYGCFDANGAPIVDVAGDGTLHPDANGYLLVKNLAPGKYGVIVTTPVAAPNWVQTSTIEGTVVIDAWVKAKEPPFFVEFGLPGPHVFVGFVQPFIDPALNGATTVTGTITDMHMSRSPDFTFYSGRPFPGCWVALNEGNAVPGRALYAQPCDANSGFSIAGIPDGSYQIKVFDINLDSVIATQPLTVAGGSCNGGPCDLGEVPIFNWFARLNTAIFNDLDQDGFWDPTEGPVGPEAGPVNIRWRDGTVYQGFPTDTEGFAPFDEVFPFFHWLVAEVGFTNKKATGVTVVVDAGGPVDKTTDAFPGFGELTPQPQVCTPAQSTNPDDPDFGCIVGADLINPNTGNNLSRSETGPVLTQAFQAFLGQTNVLQFGKAEYIDYDKTSPLPFNWVFVGENGGISGIVHYATTRAEEDPRFAVPETWEPGIPRVQVALYADGDIDCDTNPAAGTWPDGACDINWDGLTETTPVRDPNDSLIDDVNGNGQIDLADVDNYPLGWADGTAPKGLEDVDRNGNNVFDLGDALQVAWTDSWDDSQPTGCQGQNQIDVDLVGGITAEEDSRCFDGLRNFNQVRPGVFDGGYAFSDYDLTRLPAAVATKLSAFYAAIRARNGGALGANLPEAWMLPADYIVEAATPVGYKLVKEEDKNVDFGDQYIPSPQALDPVCVGDLRPVPPLLSFTTTDGSGDADKLIAGLDATEAAAPFAGVSRPLCDRKAVILGAAQNAAANFFVMTDVPIGANATGVVLNDLANEFNPNAPAFGEKYAPPYVPVAFYDWNGKLVNRVYADEFGRYNAVLPSTYSVNLPMPSGVSPNMLVSCMNDAGPIPNPAYTPGSGLPELIVDPYFDPQYSQFCYTFQYMTGATTYLDTPVVSNAAFANPPAFPVDCEQSTATPVISQVSRFLPGGAGGPFVVAGSTVGVGQRIEILSMGTMQVPDPDWDGTTLTSKTIARDYGFGDVAGSVWLEAANGTRTQLNSVPSWSSSRIEAIVPPARAPGEYQVIVKRIVNGAEVESPIGVTLTVGVCSVISTDRTCTGTEYGVRPNAVAPYDLSELYAVRRISPAAYPATPIQNAIDGASPGDLILVSPGSYEELVIMWKPVRLQGWGAGSVFLNARQVPTEKIDNWRAKVDALVTAGSIELLPGQELAPTGFPALGAPLFPTEEGAGIFVAGSSTGAARFSLQANRGARIDGLTIVGATQGGGIVLNGYAGDTIIGNNRLTANSGFYSGGIRAGHPTLSHEDVDGLVYDDAVNDRLRIHRNQIVKNGNESPNSAGAGISLYTGADNYRVQKNWVCGNFSQGSGAGIGHLGYSNNGLIEDNTVIFNESFSQATAESGGGIYLGGQPALQAVLGYLVSPGTGTVTIDANLIRGNLAGAGDGGGIRIENVNGEDILASLGNRGPWSDVLVYNNMITNNVAGLAGGGVSIENALSVTMRNNTIANNESTATTALAGVLGNPNLTEPQPAGIVSRAHSGDLPMVMTEVTDPLLPPDWLTFSDPTLIANIVYHNRSYFWFNFAPGTVTSTGLFPSSCYPPTNPSTPPCDPALEPVEDYTVDLAVLGVDPSVLLDPRRSLLTNTAAYPAASLNVMGDPLFVNPYLNGPRDNLNIPEFTTLQTAGAFDEGGNFIQVTFGPLTLLDTDAADPRTQFDYHIQAGSAGENLGGAVPTGRLRSDFDNNPRSATAADIGADERQ